MILKPTTVVLGAGASMPYGMPSGAELRSLICNNHNWLTEELYKRFLIDPSKTTDFITAFLRSNVASIDIFLSKQDRFTNIGKLCIAIILCARENQNSVIANDTDDPWYSYLWQCLIDGAQKPVDILKNKIHFITFNYDRSLEYFIHQTTKYTFGVSDDEAMGILKQIDILHVYGLLGEFHYKNVIGTRPYSNDNTTKQIDIAAKGIKIIPETRDDGDTLQTARKWFEESVNIGFLGFGFDTLNVKRLGLSAVLNSLSKKNMPTPYIIMSALGKTETETTKIAQSLFPSYPSFIHPYDQKNTMTLRMSNLLG